MDIHADIINTYKYTNSNLKCMSCSFAEGGIFRAYSTVKWDMGWIIQHM